MATYISHYVHDPLSTCPLHNYTIKGISLIKERNIRERGTLKWFWDRLSIVVVVLQRSTFRRPLPLHLYEAPGWVPLHFRGINCQPKKDTFWVESLTSNRSPFRYSAHSQHSPVWKPNHPATHRRKWGFGVGSFVRWCVVWITIHSHSFIAGSWPVSIKNTVNRSTTSAQERLVSYFLCKFRAIEPETLITSLRCGASWVCRILLAFGCGAFCFLWNRRWIIRF